MAIFYRFSLILDSELGPVQFLAGSNKMKISLLSNPTEEGPSFYWRNLGSGGEYQLWKLDI